MPTVQRYPIWEHPNFQILKFGFRALLGLVLLMKGIYFMSNSEQLETLILQSKFRSGISFLISYITFAHLFGGLFILIGLFTRIAILLQLPILIGAVFFINPAQGGFELNGEFFLSLIVLLGLFYFLFKGPGTISIDDYKKDHLL